MSNATKIVFGVVGAFLAIGVVVFAINWISAGASIVSPNNVKAQHAAVIGKWEEMIVAAENVCQVSEANTDRTSGDPLLIEDPTLAYKAVFRNIRADYQRRMKNLFEAQIVAPSGYPKTVPLPSEDRGYCDLANEMRAIQ